jgi:hypothetical protein
MVHNFRHTGRLAVEELEAPFAQGAAVATDRAIGLADHYPPQDRGEERAAYLIQALVNQLPPRPGRLLPWGAGSSPGETEARARGIDGVMALASELGVALDRDGLTRLSAAVFDEAANRPRDQSVIDRSARALTASGMEPLWPPPAEMVERSRRLPVHTLQVSAVPSGPAPASRRARGGVTLLARLQAMAILSARSTPERKLALLASVWLDGFQALPGGADRQVRRAPEVRQAAEAIRGLAAPDPALSRALTERVGPLLHGGPLSPGTEPPSLRRLAVAPRARRVGLGHGPG